MVFTLLMARFRKTTQQTLITDLRRFAGLLEQDKQIDTKELVDEFNAWMDRLHGEDFFGTEGQADPRGDHRD